MKVGIEPDGTTRLELTPFDVQAAIEAYIESQGVSVIGAVVATAGGPLGYPNGTMIVRIPPDSLVVLPAGMQMNRKTT